MNPITKAKLEKLLKQINKDHNRQLYFAWNQIDHVGEHRLELFRIRDKESNSVKSFDNNKNGCARAFVYLKYFNQILKK